MILSGEDLLKNSLYRREIATKIYDRITLTQDNLYKVYHQFQICYRINPKYTISSYAAFVFDKISGQKNLE